jgi:hypothetical protein
VGVNCLKSLKKLSICLPGKTPLAPSDINLDHILVVILLALMGINGRLTGNVLDPFV